MLRIFKLNLVFEMEDLLPSRQKPIMPSIAIPVKSNVDTKAFLTLKPKNQTWDSQVAPKPKNQNSRCTQTSFHPPIHDNYCLGTIEWVILTLPPWDCLGNGRECSHHFQPVPRKKMLEYTSPALVRNMQNLLWHKIFFLMDFLLKGLTRLGW